MYDVFKMRLLERLVLLKPIGMTALAHHSRIHRRNTEGYQALMLDLM